MMSKTLYLAMALSLLGAGSLVPQTPTPKKPSPPGLGKAAEAPAPKPVAVDPNVTHTVKLTWVATCVAPSGTNVCDPTVSYNVYKYGGFPGNNDPVVCAAVGISAYNKVATATTQTSYSENGIPEGVTRCYYVTALDSVGVESDPSAILSVLVVLPIPPKPSPPSTFTSVVQ